MSRPTWGCIVRPSRLCARCSLRVPCWRLDGKAANQNRRGQKGSPAGNTQSSGKQAQPTQDTRTSWQTVRDMRAFGRLRNPLPTQRVELPVDCKSNLVASSFKLNLNIILNGQRQLHTKNKTVTRLECIAKHLQYPRPLARGP